jgi:DNA-binding CsgD family transcriptional regulator
MTARTITTRDLHTLVDLSDPQHPGESTESVWEAVLSMIKAVVSCDAVSFQIQDVPGRRIMAIRQFHGAYEHDDEPDDATDEMYWRLFWSSHFSYAQRTGDYFTVTKASDFEPSGPRSADVAPCEVPTCHDCREARVMLPQLGSLDYRIMLWRSGGSDFSDRDLQLLAVLRPHLIAIRDATMRPQPQTRQLTRRQCQLLSLLATGLTNRQVARQLGVSEHTVRKHVENIYERLQVNSRTAAVTRAFGANSSA